MSGTPTRISVTAVEELLGTVPFLLGFYPRDSFVVIFIGSAGRIRGAARVDSDTAPSDLVGELRPVLGGEITHVAVLGYGGPDNRDALNAVHIGLSRYVSVIAVLWVDNTEFRCVLDGCKCTAAGGVAFDPRATVSAATLAYDGHIAARSRAEQLATLTADLPAQTRVEALIARQAAISAYDVVADALTDGERGERLTDSLVAALAVALRRPEAFEQAWRATGDEPWQRQLWFDMVRRVPDSHVSPVATLAAWWSWRTGDEMLARAALSRAKASSDYTQAVQWLVDNHADPASLPWPMTGHTEIALRLIGKG